MTVRGARSAEGDPTLAAEAFARANTSASQPFDFSIASLARDVEAFLMLRCAAQQSRSTPDSAADGGRIEAALGAYVGETLARCCGGNWAGRFRADNPGPNFYSSWVAFGGYKFFPSHYVGYRLASGAAQGTFASYLERVLPAIRARLDPR
jgi:hypothetical protein